MTEIIEKHSEFSGCANNCNKNFFKSILIKHEITYDTVMKRHLHHRCLPLKGQGAMPRSPVYLVPNTIIIWFKL